jgi:hypothetical protein
MIISVSCAGSLPAPLVALSGGWKQETSGRARLPEMKQTRKADSSAGQRKQSMLASTKPQYCCTDANISFSHSSTTTGMQTQHAL